MACSHADTCPLHPHLSNSLAAWRTHYCNSDSNWAIAPDMSRSLTGEPTPLALLPNGKMIRVGAASSDTTAVSETGTETAASTATATAVLNDIEPDAVPELTHIVPTTFWQRLKFVFRGNS